MLEVIVHPLPELTAETVESPVPIPGPDEVLVKVKVAGSIVKGISLSSQFPSYYDLRLNIPRRPSIDYCQ